MTTATLDRPQTFGSTAALAEWNQAPIDATGEGDAHIRNDILFDAGCFQAFGVKGNKVIVKTLRGRVIFETIARNGQKLVIVDYVSSAYCRIRFWMAASDLAELSAKLKAAPECRRPFNAIYVGV